MTNDTLQDGTVVETSAAEGGAAASVSAKTSASAESSASAADDKAGSASAESSVSAADDKAGSESTELSAAEKEAMENELVEKLQDEGQVILGWGFGRHFILIVLVPFILLLSYTKSYQNTKIDVAIPFAGIILALLVSLE